MFSLPPQLNSVLLMVAQRLAAVPKLRWLVGGSAALALHGLALPRPPRDLDLVSDATGAEHVAAVLTAGDQPVSVVQLLAPVDDAKLTGLRARFSFNGVEVDLLADARSRGALGTLHCDLHVWWPRRTLVSLPSDAGEVAVGLLPLEYLLVLELVRERPERADLIAAHLHQRGFAWDAFSGLLAAMPGLEEPLYDVLNRVVPLARRAAKRRAKRKADKEIMDFFLRRGEHGPDKK
ncbi:MAG: hypothetical protein MUD01_16360 [Chloroflexaceae bacterium]|jgi:hypothetical protein|nr:hypothetical protein [Chloroflexaceae bacterium]